MGEELFYVVDENDNVLGKATRNDCHSTGKTHRGVHIFVQNSKGEVLLGKRSMSKDKYPGFWGDIAGHVDYGESYDDAAKRELMEEAGIESELEFVCDFKKREKTDNENLRLFLCVHDGKFRMNEEECDKMDFFDFDKVLQKVENGEMKIASGAFKAMNIMKERRGK